VAEAGVTHITRGAHMAVDSSEGGVEWKSEVRGKRVLLALALVETATARWAAWMPTGATHGNDTLPSAPQLELAQQVTEGGEEAVV
jgi:hypothetical protein